MTDPKFLETDSSVAEMLKHYNPIQPVAKITPDEWIELKRELVRLEKVNGNQGKIISKLQTRLSDAAKVVKDLINRVEALETPRPHSDGDSALS